MGMLTGKTAIITGASRGIGAAIAERFAKEGANLTLVTRSTPLDSLIEKLGTPIEAMTGDVGDSAFADQVAKQTKEKFGKIDILVNNAGVTRDGLLVRMKDEDFDEVIRVNLKGAFVTTRAVGKIMMKQRSGAIINISSVVGMVGNAGQANYCASKAGLIGLTKSTAKELGGRGIRINAIAPGFIETDMTGALGEKVKEQTIATIPLGSFGKVDDISAGALFLASDESAYITGHTLVIDGGMAM